MTDPTISTNRVFRPARPTGPAKPQPATGSLRGPAPGQASFQDILHGKLNDRGVTLSQHAEARLKQRGIEMKPEVMAKLGSAIDKAAAKGAKDSLILYQDTAFIVNVKNRTVITAVDGPSMQDNVFTQIDSAVIIS